VPTNPQHPWFCIIPLFLRGFRSFPLSSWLNPKLTVKAAAERLDRTPAQEVLGVWQVRAQRSCVKADDRTGASRHPCASVAGRASGPGVGSRGRGRELRSGRPEQQRSLEASVRSLLLAPSIPCEGLGRQKGGAAGSRTARRRSPSGYHSPLMPTPTPSLGATMWQNDRIQRNDDPFRQVGCW
jgi:hypothetical protein